MTLNFHRFEEGLFILLIETPFLKSFRVYSIVRHPGSSKYCKSKHCCINFCRSDQTWCTRKVVFMLQRDLYKFGILLCIFYLSQSFCLTFQPYLRRRKFKLFACFLEATMVSCTDGPVEFEVSIGLWSF